VYNKHKENSNFADNIREVIKGRRQKMKRSLYIKKLISTLLVMTIVFPLMPLGEIRALAQDGMSVTSINIIRTSTDLGNFTENAVHIEGENLGNTVISYLEEGGNEYKPLSPALPGSTGGFRQFKIPSDITISHIRVGDNSYAVPETGMPRITSVEPKQIDLLEEPEITIKGVNFDSFGDGQGERTTIKIANQELTEQFQYSWNEATLYMETLEKLGFGNKNIIIERETNQSLVNIKTTYNHNKAFRIYTSIDIGENDAIIYPNRGQIGSITTITINGKKEDYSIFFLEEETSLFKYEYMGEIPEYQQTIENKSIVKVRVPKGLKTGRTYKVFITNNLDEQYGNGKAGDDLTNNVHKQKYIGEYYVVDASVGPMIYNIDPKEGTSSGSYVTIYGRRFEELDIDDLKDRDNKKVNNLDIDRKFIINDPTELRIEYELDGETYRGQEVTNITRDFLVTIGRDTLFETVHIAENEFVSGEDRLDKLYVKTKTIEQEDLIEPKKDVVVAITTTITVADGTEHNFTEVPTYFGYTFLPSYLEPIIESATPIFIQVNSVDNPETMHETILSIRGQNFNVLRYSVDGEMRTNYPTVVIGGANDLDGEIIIEKDWEGRVYYKTKDMTEKEEIKGAILEVLNTNGNVVTGVGGNEVGNSIAVTIPKGLKVTQNIIGKPLPIAMVNPKRDSYEKGDLFTSRPDLITFVANTTMPTIESVNPYIVTVDGGEDITIEGRDFREGIEVYIGGVLVPGVNRDLDRQTTKGVLTFKAPRGKEGITILQVMNTDGGSDTHEFIYVETLRIDPKITSITPPRGTEGDVIIIKGDNFLKQDPTVPNLDGINMNKLLGTKVYLDNVEVNTYVDGGRLESYEPPTILNEPLLINELDPLNKVEKLYLSPHYKEATVKDINDNPYKIVIDREGRINLVGMEKDYTFYLEDGQIKGRTGNAVYDVEQEEDKLFLISATEEIQFTVNYDYNLLSVVANQSGKEEIKLASYYDSIVLEQEGKYYKIVKDELNLITITDEKNDDYDLRISSGKIVATKGGSSYDVDVQGNSLVFDSKTFEFMTPYYFDPTTKVITGHRVRVLNRNEIEITIPQKQIPKLYDVKVENPDTKAFTVKKGFEYTIPQENPIIHYIDPAEGSVDGGYYITIYGEDFGDNPEVRIDGILVSPGDTVVNKQDYKSIKVLVPKYTGDIDEDFVIDKKFVRVHITSGGASTSRKDLFAYKLASSKPRITRILPNKGSASGGNIVEIYGEDFRFFEPYRGNPPKPGDTNFEDIDGDGKWTNYLSERDPDLPRLPLNDLTIKDYTEYVDSPVLPNIYFGNEKAKIVEFTKLSGDNYRIMVIAPERNIGGAVDVYLRNNDSGQSNLVKYTYEVSNPQIKTINPKTAKRAGGDVVDIVATGYQGSKIRLVGPLGTEMDTTMYLVRFGDITNRDIPREDENSGLIKGTVGAKVELKDSGFTAEIKGDDLTLTLKQGDMEYKGNYKLGNEVKFINLKTLKDQEGKNYQGFELVRVEINDGRLFVDRGFSTSAEERVKGTLEVIVPSYHQIGNVDVTLVNSDGISNKVIFSYVSPGSNPKINNITKDGADPTRADDGRTRIVQVNNRGGNLIKVYGSDFRPNAAITIGNDFITIPSSAVEFISEEELSFTMPAVTDESKLGGWHHLIVKNEDLGSARSDQATPTPIYIEFTKGESNPEIGNLVPDRGPATGGTKVTINGKDFRQVMEGFTGKIKVFFGEKEIKDVEFDNYGSIRVTAPASDVLGPVRVKVENPDGTQTMGNLIFNYISKPSIKDVNPKRLFTNDTNTEVTINGEQFQQGAKVIIGGSIILTKDIKDNMTVNGEGIRGVDKGANIEVSVVGGVEVTSVQVLEDNEIKVTFPETKELDNTSIIIINPDGGVSEPYNNFKYQTPIPLRPMILEGIPGYESTVKLIWNESDPELLNRATDYEIFGKKTIDKENHFIGSTKTSEFLVRGLEQETEYTFMVRALNEYGVSLDFATVTVKTLSSRQDPKQEEKEEKLKEEERDLRENGREGIVDGRYTITMGTKAFRANTATLDLTLSKYGNQNKFTIAIPLELARNDNRLTVKDGTMTAVINAHDLYTLQVSRQDSGDKDAYVRIHIDKTTGTHLPMGKMASSRAYDMDFDYIYGRSTMKIDQLVRNGLIFMDQDSLTYPNTKNTKLYNFDIETGEYTSTNNTTMDIRGKAKFILLSDR